MELGLAPLLLLCFFLSISTRQQSTNSTTIRLQKLKAKRVKLYDATPKILEALRNTDIEVCIMVPNDLINNISSNQTLANQWVHDMVVPFYPQTLIRFLLVGNEILSGWQDKSVYPNLVPAMRKMKLALKTHGITKVKVGTPSATDVLDSIAFPPSNGLTYHNLFGQMVDTLIFAMKLLGYPDIPIWIAETGWPSTGDYDQIGANLQHAATYKRNVIKKFTAKPPVGKPARPGVVLPSFIFALYNENTKPGQTTERNFGLLWPNGLHVYEIDLTGKTPESEFKALPPTNDNKAYLGPIWCVVKEVLTIL
ncbi:hypothetical protein ACLB2K_016214 [Fragaria x ananassa]